MLCNRKKSIFLALFLVSLITVASAIFWVSIRIRINPPNILLITIDALRPDHLNCYGYKRNTSPNIDEIAKCGVIFKQAISQASVTVVSLASLITSMYPTRHGIITQHLDFNKDFTCPTITEILKSKNYRTAVFLPENSAIGVTKWTDKGVDYRVNYPHENGNPDYLFLNQKIMEWTKNNLRQSFFIWIHYRGVHTSYTPPSPYDKLFVADEFYDSIKKVPLVDNLQGWGGISKKANLHNIQEVGYYISQYDGAIKYVDYWIGELLDYLKKERLYNNTMIIISADHGEAFGEHGLYFEHANTLYDELLKIPLIIRFPRDKFGNKSLKMQVKLVDVMPTILEYLNLQISNYTDGVSLLPIIKGKGTYKGNFSFSKTHVMNAIRSGEWKLISYDNQPSGYELYNLKQDPDELKNLNTKEKDIVKNLKEELIKSYTGFSCSCSNKELENDYESKRTKEIVRSLGYIQ